MAWIGERIKDLLENKSMTQETLAQEVGVSRQALSKWIKGQTPTGSHLVRLCGFLGVPADYFFTAEPGRIAVPAHRTRGNAKNNEVMQDEALELARSYELFFRQAPEPGLVPSLRSARTEEDAQRAAVELRGMAGATDDRPLSPEQIFRLYERLKISLIPVPFPPKVKSYAFYVRINGHRVVFLNRDSNRLDMTFALVHDAVHAARDEESASGRMEDLDEEAFCDRVANLVQFPDRHVDEVGMLLRGMPSGRKINTLKRLCLREDHAMYGVAKRLEERSARFSLKVAGADANLHKSVETVDEAFLVGNDARTYMENLRRMSPVFMRLLVESAHNLGLRMLGELLHLDWLDAKELKKELTRAAEHV